MVGRNNEASTSNQNFASKKTKVVQENSGIKSQYNNNVDSQATKGQIVAQQQQTR